jgi:hypothetical protein
MHCFNLYAGKDFVRQSAWLSHPFSKHMHCTPIAMLSRTLW